MRRGFVRRGGCIHKPKSQDTLLSYLGTLFIGIQVPRVGPPFPAVVRVEARLALTASTRQVLLSAPEGPAADVARPRRGPSTGIRRIRTPGQHGPGGSRWGAGHAGRPTACPHQWRTNPRDVVVS